MHAENKSERKKDKERTIPAHILTWQVRKEQDALIEAVGQETVPELLQYGHADTERERGVTQEQRVPQVEDLVQREHICMTGAEINTTKGRFDKMTEYKSA